MTGPVDILAIGPHPDDVEIGCGGAILRATDAGARVVIADLSAGEMATRGSVEERERERHAAAALLGVGERRQLGFPDTGIGGPGQSEALIALIRDVRPRIVLAPHGSDRHPDHEAAARLIREACFLAGVARAGAGAPHRPARLYHYMIHEPFEPALIIDVGDVWPRRMAAVHAYASQFAPREGAQTAIGNAAFLELLTARAAHFGALIGAARGEPFACRGPIGLSRFPEIVAGEHRPKGYAAYL